MFNQIEDSVKDDKYLNPKVRSWDGNITSNFQGSDIPHNRDGKAEAVLKLRSVYQQRKNTSLKFM